MTWTRLDDGFYDDPVLLALPRSTRLLHVEALVWCNAKLTDGAIPRYVLARISDEPDAPTAIKELVTAGLWEETSHGWVIVDFIEGQQSSEAVKKRREGWATDKRRQRLHKAGDHSLCDYCKGNVQGGHQGGLHRGVRAPDPTRPVRTGGEGRGGRRPTGSASAEATADPPAPPQGKTQASALGGSASAKASTTSAASHYDMERPKLNIEMPEGWNQ